MIWKILVLGDIKGKRNFIVKMIDEDVHDGKVMPQLINDIPKKITRY